MFIVIGLGNPGEKYGKTRHNTGFIIVDFLAKVSGFPEFKKSKKVSAETSEGKIEAKRVLFAKPQTFMNNSGKSISELLGYQKNGDKELIVIHDDIDLSLGKIRIVKNRGAAGHKGIESIIKSLGGKDFIRIRIGISKEHQDLKHRKAEEFVLKSFTKKEERILKEVAEKVKESIKLIIEGELEKAMTIYNR